MLYTPTTLHNQHVSLRLHRSDTTTSLKHKHKIKKKSQIKKDMVKHQLFDLLENGDNNDNNLKLKLDTIEYVDVIR